MKLLASTPARIIAWLVASALHAAAGAQDHAVPAFSKVDSMEARVQGCVTCHGRVDEMGRVEKKAALNMQWCLQCHRAVEQARLGDSKDALTDGLSPEWFEPEPPSTDTISTDHVGTDHVGTDNVSHYDPLRGSLFHTRVAQEFGREGKVTSLTTCSACHR